MSKDTKGSKKAVLHYEVLSIKKQQEMEKDVLERKDDLGREDVTKSFVKIHLETGRHHQIRVQMAHAGYPLVGDKKYNSNCGKEYIPIALCSVRLSFLHPTTGKLMEYRIEPEGERFSFYHK